MKNEGEVLVVNEGEDWNDWNEGGKIGTKVEEGFGRDGRRVWNEGKWNEGFQRTR